MIEFIKTFTWQTWALLLESLFIIIVILAFIFRHRKSVKAFINWIRTSAEGENKTASGRRLTAFAITGVCYIGGTISFFIHGFEKNIDPWLFIAKFFLDIIFVGLLWGFINQQTLVALKNGGSITTTSQNILKTESTTTTSNNTIPDEEIKS